MNPYNTEGGDAKQEIQSTETESLDSNVLDRIAVAAHRMFTMLERHLAGEITDEEFKQLNEIDQKLLEEYDRTLGEEDKSKEAHSAFDKAKSILDD